MLLTRTIYSLRALANRVGRAAAAASLSAQPLPWFGRPYGLQKNIGAVHCLPNRLWGRTQRTGVAYTRQHRPPPTLPPFCIARRQGSPDTVCADIVVAAGQVPATMHNHSIRTWPIVATPGIWFGRVLPAAQSPAGALSSSCSSGGSRTLMPAGMPCGMAWGMSCAVQTPARSRLQQAAGYMSTNCPCSSLAWS